MANIMPFGLTLPNVTPMLVSPDLVALTRVLAWVVAALVLLTVSRVTALLVLVRPKRPPRPLLP